MIELAFQGITLLLQLLPLGWRQLDVAQACGEGAKLAEQWLLSTRKGGELGLTLFDFLGSMVEAEDGWVDPLDLLDEPGTEGLENVADDESAVEADRTEKSAPEPVRKKEMQQ